MAWNFKQNISNPPSPSWKTALQWADQAWQYGVTASVSSVFTDKSSADNDMGAAVTT